MRTQHSAQRRAGTITFGALRVGQRFRLLDAHGAPVLTVLYTRIPETTHRGVRQNAVGWATQPHGPRRRHYGTLAPATPVLLDTVTLLPEEADAVAPFLTGAAAFDPATTPGPPPDSFDPNLEDIW